MSEAITFDTHRFIKRLTETGMSEATAEALADEQINLLNGNLATKQDIAAIHRDIADIHRDIAEVKAGLEVKIEATKADLLKWMIGLLVAQTGLIISVVKFIP